MHILHVNIVPPSDLVEADPATPGLDERFADTDGGSPSVLQRVRHAAGIIARSVLGLRG